ncbi:MAG: hypothetical protein ACJ0E8_04750, partial [Gammaproteobacteria bacterium]
TGDNSTTDFTMSKSPPDARNILVTLDGVVQHPSDASTTRALLPRLTTMVCHGFLIQIGLK